MKPIYSIGFGLVICAALIGIVLPPLVLTSELKTCTEQVNSERALTMSVTKGGMNDIHRAQVRERMLKLRGDFWQFETLRSGLLLGDNPLTNKPGAPTISQIDDWETDTLSKLTELSAQVPNKDIPEDVVNLLAEMKKRSLVKQ